MSRSRVVLSEYRTYDLPPDFPVLVLEGDDWLISPVRSSNLHFHNCVEIGFCRSGRGKMTLNREEREFHAGDVTLLGSRVHHTTWSDPDSPSLWSYVFLDPIALFSKDITQREALRTISGFGCFILSGKDFPWFSQLLEEIIREMREAADGYRDCVRGMFLILFSRLIRLFPPEAGQLPVSGENPVLMPALTLIQEQYATDFSMEELAARCHLSSTHFRRLFHEQIGTAPLDYLHQIRISASCSLLRSTDDSIASIAGQVGYSSLSCFNRHFLQVMGMVPSQWRKTDVASPRPSRITFTGWTRAETTEEILRKEGK